MNERGAARPVSVTSEVQVRAARAEDVDAIARIECASFTDPWTAASFRALIGNAQVYFAVATAAGQLVGYVIAWFMLDEAEIANLAVDGAARGRGIGSTLLDTALEAAAARGITSVFLEVRESNTAARALYASRAFEQIGRRRGYYRRPVEDAVVMRRRLEQASGRASPQ